MDIDRRFLTLLTPEGEFLKARKEKQEYIIGQEIDFFPINVVQKKSSLFYQLPGKKALAAAMFAIVIASAAFLPMSGSNDVYAYMSIDVNPSIELAVNEDLEVVSMKAYNSEGKQVISEINSWKKKDVSVVTTQIIEEIKEQGYFENHDEVVISTVYEDKKQEEIEKKLEEDIELIEEKVEEENLQLTVVHGTKEEREKAHKQGITTGKLKENQPKIEKKEENKQNSSNDNQAPIEKDKGKDINKKNIYTNDQGKKDKDQEKVQNKGKTQAPGQLKKTEEKTKEKKNKVGSKGKGKKKKDNARHNEKKVMKNHQKNHSEHDDDQYDDHKGQNNKDDNWEDKE